MSLQIDVVSVPGSDQDTGRAPCGTLTTFEDPDGNGWVLQQPRRA